MRERSVLSVLFVCLRSSRPSSPGSARYNIVKMGFEAGKAAATGDISGILATIGKIKGTETHAFDLQRLVACRRNAK